MSDADDLKAMLALPATEWVLHMPARPYEPEWTSSSEGYTDDDMRAYALAHIVAERERCAALCLRPPGWLNGRTVKPRGIYPIGPEAYAALLRSARDVFARGGTVEVCYLDLGASMLNVGHAPRLAADLGTRWRRDETNGRMIFGA